jgi:hypothetical protein
MASNAVPDPQPQGEIQSPNPQAQAVAHQPQQILAQSLSISQTAPYVPSHVWTPEILLDYHKKLYETGIDNNRLLENFRIREHHLAWAGIVLVAGIIGFGGYLVVTGNALGKEIIGGTVIFLAGYLAGQGKANVK